MKTFSFKTQLKLRKSCLILLFLSLPTWVLSQALPTLTSINVMLKPPYSSNYSAYENLANHAIITLVGGQSPMDIVLHGQLTHLQGDWMINTQPNYIGGIFSLGINQTKVLINDMPSMLFLNRNNVDHSGVPDEVWSEILKTGQLPEGPYSLCVEAYYYDVNGALVFLKNACFNFTISLAQAPMITSPVNGQELNPQLPNTVFSWTPPIGNIMGANIAYDLYVVKVPQGQDPNDAMSAAVNYKANNPLIKTNLTGNQYVTQPYDLKIDTNALYAVQVVARDLNKQVGFKNFGRSEVVTFTKGKALNLAVVVNAIKPPEKKPSKPSPGYTVTNFDPVPYSQLKGKLYYRFKDMVNSNPSGKLQQDKPGQINAQQGQVKANTNILTGGNKENADNLIYNTDNTPVGDAKPLAGMKVSLVVTYLFTGSLNGKDMNGEPGISNHAGFAPKDNDKVLATTVTESDGSFTFNFVNAEKTLGLIDPDFKFKHTGEFGDIANGKIFKVLRLRVEDKYYCSPDVNIKIDPWKGNDLGTMISFVKSYTLKLNVVSTPGTFWDMAQGQRSPLPGITATIVRKSNLPSVPVNEGDGKGTIGFISKAESGKDGSVTFYHMVQHDLNNKGDVYYIKCTPDKMKGDFIFKEQEKRYYPTFDKDLKNFPFNSTSTYVPKTKGGLNMEVMYGEDITWNHQLEIKTYTDSVFLYPDKPRIAGKVQDATNIEAKAMSGVKVVMVNSYQSISDPSKLFTTVKTNSLGRYEFNNLPVELGDFVVGQVSSVVGPSRTLVVKPDGYKAGVLPASAKVSDSLWKINDSIMIANKQKPLKHCVGCYPPLKWGQQLLNQDFFLTPDGFLSGYVVDESGNPVRADIDVDGFSKTSTKFQFTYGNSEKTTFKKLTASQKGQQNVSFNEGKPANNKGPQMFMPTGAREYFSMAAPSGKRKVTITPVDKDYSLKDTVFIIQKDNKNPVEIKFVVLKSQKRIRFKVAEQPAEFKGRFKPGTQGSMNAKPISGATVQLNIPGKTITQTSDKDGYVTFVFSNSGFDFDFEITPPANADYETGNYKITGVQNTTAIKDYGYAYLKKAATISGVVTIGADKKALAGAKVYIETGGGKTIEATTGNDGKYELKGVATSPAEKTVWAGKSGAVPNIISQSKKISIGQKNELDFNLVNDNELVIENIFGFEADIQNKTKQSDGTWLVSGNIINLPSNDNFSLQDKKLVIPFQNLKIKKSEATKNGIPVGVPAENTLSTDLANIKLLLQNSFGIIQKPSTGDVLQIKAENQKGRLMGKMAVQKSSFQFTQNYVTFNSDPNEAMLLTEKPGSFNTDLPSVEAGTSSKKKFGLANLQGKSLNYTLLGFSADADAANSWIQDNSISLQTMIHINSLPGMSPSTLDINAGNLVIHPEKLETLKGDQPIKFNLEKWQFTGNNWQLSQSNSSIQIATGTMKTGSIDVPLSDISLKPDHIDIGNYDVNNLTFGGVIPINVTATNPQFGYNKSIGSDQKAHYELRLIGENGNPGVIIKSLPGMKAGDEMKFQNLSLVSNGEQILNPGNQPNTTTFYSVMKVKPLAFISGADYVNMTCGIDLSIPQLQETSGVIQFTKEAGKIKLMLYPLNVSLKGPGDVDFFANVQFSEHPQNLTEGKFTALGTIQDKEGIVLKGVLNKTTTAAWVQVDPENQKLPLGGGNASLANIKGKMEADMSTNLWKNFTFSGDMQGFKGMKGDTRKTFVVTGSINASNEKIEVNNIPSGFGNIGLTYDIANSRFTGNLQLDKKIGPMAISGTASLLVDPGGWYFLAGGKVQTPGLGAVSAGLLIGDYNSMPGNVSGTLMQYAYDKNVPPSFQNGISGFFFTGMKELPVLNIPNYSIDLGVISASFGAQAGLDARLWMDFGSSGNEYGIGAMVFAHAYLKGASITCTKFGAEARAELGLKGKYSTATGAFSLNGCGSFTIGGSIQQCFPTPCWSDGICCKGCGGIGVNQGIKVDLLLDSNGNTDLSFGFGNCSGQAVMSGNW